MKFERARSKEQKSFRINQIIDAAVKLYNEISYEKITLAGIANELSFTRANLYKYVSSKEEIFLKVIERDEKDWIADLIDSFKDKSNISHHEFAEIWAKKIYQHKMLIQLMSIQYSVIEKNTTVEKLSDFKRQFYKENETVYKMINKLLPDLSYDGITTFLYMQFFFAVGLYPATTENEVQRKAIEISNAPFPTPDFVDMFSRFIIMTIEGLIKEN